MTLAVAVVESAEHTAQLDHFRSLLVRSMVPTHIHEGIIGYIVDGHPTGSFLEAIFSNNLTGAVARADAENLYRLTQIVTWVIHNAPAPCFGSAKAYENWKGIDGWGRER